MCVKQIVGTLKINSLQTSTAEDNRGIEGVWSFELKETRPSERDEVPQENCVQGRVGVGFLPASCSVSRATAPVGGLAGDGSRQLARMTADLEGVILTEVRCPFFKNHPSPVLLQHFIYI